MGENSILINVNYCKNYFFGHYHMPDFIGLFQDLLGHFLAVFGLFFLFFVIFIIFGQFLGSSGTTKVPLPVRTMNFENPPDLRLVKFELLEFWGNGGGLQYFDVVVAEY